MSDFLKIKNNIFIKELGNGEFFMMDPETGIWIKTSLSFKKILSYMKKGLPEVNLKKILTHYYEKRSKDINLVINTLKENGFLEGYSCKFIKTPIDRIKQFIFLAPIKAIKTDLDMLFDNLGDSFEIKFEIREDDVLNLSEYLNMIRILLGKKNCKIIVRLDWKIIREDWISYLCEYVKNLEVNLANFWEENEMKIEKINMMRKVVEKKNINLQIRYQFSNIKGKLEDLFLPIFSIPNSSYYFVLSEIFENENKAKSFKRFFKNLNDFYKMSSVSTKSLIEIPAENLFVILLFSDILKDSCGAGKTNFYVSENGYIYPCKYLKEFSLGKINKFSNFLKNKEIYVLDKCKTCELLKLCSGICIRLQKEENFYKICNFFKKLLYEYIRRMHIGIVKEISKYKENKKGKQDLYSDQENIVKNIRRRLLCPIGTF